jgi:hypothetical protein
MSDLNNETGVATFPVTMYVLILSYLAPILAPYSGMLDVLIMISMIKFASASVMFSVMKFTHIID